jgi:hypothetical protein
MWGERRRVARFALSVGVAFLVCGATASAAFATTFTANVAPGSVPAGTTTQFNIALTNTSQSAPLNSAVIKVPDTFGLVSASLGAQPGNTVVSSKKVTLTGLGLNPGQTDTIEVTALASCVPDTGYLWDLTAYTQGVGSQQLYESSPSSVTADITGACSLAFVTEPNNALVNAPITGNSYDQTGPPITVQVLDANGNPTTVSTGVTMDIGSDTPADNDGAGLGGVEYRNAPNGVATFKGLTVSLPDNGYTLVASAWDITSGESTQFDIGDGETDCNMSMDCLLTLTGADSTLTIDAGPNNGQLSGQVDPGTPMDGSGSNPKADPGCADYQPVNVDWYGFDLSNVNEDEGTPGKSVTWTVQDVTPQGFMVCFGSTGPFLTVSPGGDVVRAPAGTLPDGSSGSVGFLPFCDQLGDISDREPCITDDPLSTQSDPNSSTGEDVIVDVTIPPDFSGDPFMGK